MSLNEMPQKFVESTVRFAFFGFRQSGGRWKWNWKKKQCIL